MHPNCAPNPPKSPKVFGEKLAMQIFPGSGGVSCGRGVWGCSEERVVMRRGIRGRWTEIDGSGEGGLRVRGSGGVVQWEGGYGGVWQRGEWGRGTCQSHIISSLCMSRSGGLSSF